MLRGLRTVAWLRFREAMAGRVTWLVPIYFVVALAVAATSGGPDRAARIEAADGATLALAALLGVAAAAVLGSTALPTERDRPRGLAILTAPVSPTVRVLGALCGSGAVLLLVVGALLASALAAVDVAVGVPSASPRVWKPAQAIEGGEATASAPQFVWLHAAAPTARIRLPSSLSGATTLRLDVVPRVSDDGFADRVRLRARFDDDPPPGREYVRPFLRTFEIPVPPGTREVHIQRVEGNFDLGLAVARSTFDAGPLPRAASRGLHAVALAAGLVALLAVALALSTVTGGGVAAAAGVTLVLLCLARGLFQDAAVDLAHAGAVAAQREHDALHGDDHGDDHAGHDHGTGAAGDGITPPTSLAPMFRFLGRALPDAAAFDLSGEVAAGRAPPRVRVASLAVKGTMLAALFTLLAVVGAARRP